MKAQPKATRKTRRVARRVKRKKSVRVARRIARPKVHRVPKRPVAKPVEGLILGNGTPRSEALAAAKRLVGLTGGFVDDSFLRHILVVTATGPRTTTTKARFVTAIFSWLKAAGKASRTATPQPGDLAFFRGTSDLDGDGKLDAGLTMAAVVERRLPDGVVVCIGPVLGRVKRFHVDPTRPTVQRSEVTTRQVNDVIRPRALGDTKPGLAGALWAGYARL